MEDGEWKNAAVLNDFILSGMKRKAVNRTEVYLLKDKHVFYLAAKCFDSEMDKLSGKDWFDLWVDLAYNLGLMEGTGEGRFSPHASMTVAEALQLAAEMESRQTGDNFHTQSHTEGGVWYRPAVDYCIASGIIDTRNLPMDDRKVEWLFRHTINDGGQFTGVSDLITKYGIVPSNVMPETWAANHTSGMSRLLDLKLKEFGLELREMTGPKKELPAMLEARKVEMLAFVYRFLVLNLGEPPAEFTWTMYDAEGKPVSTKTYTPKSFYDEYVGVDLKNNYVMLMNDPTREFYKVYEIEYDRHQYDGKNWLYINLPIEEIEAIAIASIKDGTMMYFSCDVGKFLDRQNGVLDVDYYDYGSLMGTTFGMDKRERILTGASGSSHAMTLMAVDLDEYGQAKKWKVENSWGMTGHEGHLVMTDEWFEEYMFRLVAEKKYVPENILKLLDTKPTMLPPWDPMFADEL